MSAVVQVFILWERLQYCKLTAVPYNEMLRWTDIGDVNVMFKNIHTRAA
jgi:hypothetical protein